MADGPAVIETFSVEPQRDGSRTAALVCRDLAGRRFLATAVADDKLLDLLADEDVEPIGRRVHVRHVDHLNRAALTRATLDRWHPVRPARLDGEHTRIRVAVDGPVVELALLRPLLDRRTHAECDEVVSAWLDDPHLRVLLLHADGPDFCEGLDPAEIGWGGTLVTPPHGVAGLTGRLVGSTRWRSPRTSWAEPSSAGPWSRASVPSGSCLGPGAPRGWCRSRREPGPERRTWSR